MSGFLIMESRIHLRHAQPGQPVDPNAAAAHPGPRPGLGSGSTINWNVYKSIQKWFKDSKHASNITRTHDIASNTHINIKNASENAYSFEKNKKYYHMGRCQIGSLRLGNVFEKSSAGPLLLACVGSEGTRNIKKTKSWKCANCEILAKSWGSLRGRSPLKKMQGGAGGRSPPARLQELILQCKLQE